MNTIGKYSSFLCLKLVLMQSVFAQTVFTDASWGNFERGAETVCDDKDIDNDNDGLIELCYLEDLDAMRYQLDGNGYRISTTVTKITDGCPDDGCKGYELVRDLDFNENDSYRDAKTNKPKWTTNEGWPIVTATPDNSEEFSGTLEGNGHSISNLFINRRNDNHNIGLLRNIAETGRIQNLGLQNINVHSESGDISVLVGDENKGTIINCYIQGRLSRPGINGNLPSGTMAIFNSGEISNSYLYVHVPVRAKIIPSYFVYNNNGKITNSYINARVNKINIGAIVANNLNNSVINNMYIISNSIDYIVGTNRGSMKDIYANEPLNRHGKIAPAIINIGDITSINNVRGFSTDELQSALAPGATENNPYFRWTTTNWVFTPSDQYPALKHIRGDDADNLACNISQQPKCGSLLRRQRNVQPEITSPTATTKITVPEGEEQTISVTVSDNNIYDKLTVELSAASEGKVVDLVTTWAVVRPNGKARREPVGLKIRIPAKTEIGLTTQLRLVTIDDGGFITDDGDFTNVGSDEVFLDITVGEGAKNTTPTIERYDTAVTVKAGREQTITAKVSDANTNDALTLSLTAADTNQDIVEVVTASVEVPTNGSATRDAQTLRIKGLKAGTATLNLTVSDGDTISEVSRVTVTVEANAQPTIMTSPTNISLLEGNSTTLNVVIADADSDDLSVKLYSSDIAIATATITTRDETHVLKITGKGGGTTTITVIVNDGRAQTNSEASLVFTVIVEAKAPPTIERYDTAVTVKAGREQTITAKVSDANTNDALTLSLTAADTNQDIVEVVTASVEVPTNGSATRDTQTLRIKGLKAGTATLNLTVSDGDTISEVSRVTVTVEANAQPTIMTSPTNISLLEGNSTTLNVVIADADSDDLSVKLDSSDIAIATATITTRDETHVLKITGKGGGTAMITVIVNDGRAQTNSEASLVFTVIVEAKAPPTIERYDTAVTVKAGREQTITAKVSDANTNDALTLSLTAADTNQGIVEVVTASVEVPTNGSATRDAQTLRIKGLKAGTATLNLTVSDGDTTSEVSRVTVTVEANAQPTIMTSPTNISLLEGNSTTLNVVIADADSDDLSVKLDSSDIAIATATITTRDETHVLKITGKGGGTTTITVIVNDGRAQTNSEASLVFTVIVEANAVPTITISPSADQTMQLSSTASIVVRVEDENFDVGDLVTVRAVSSTPSVVRVTPKYFNEIKGDMNQRFMIHGLVAGKSRIQFTAKDSKNTSDSKSVLVHVNTPPSVVVANVTTQVATIGQEFTLKTSKFFTDEDKDTLIYSITTSSIVPKSLADRLAFSTTGTLTFTPIRTEASTNTSAAGRTVTVSVDDDRGSSATAEFTLLINAEPEPNEGVSIIVSGNIDGNTCDKWLLCAKSTVTDANGIADTTYQWYRGDELIKGGTAATYEIPDGEEARQTRARTGGTVYKVDVTFVDNIGQSETFSTQHIVVNEKPIIKGFDAPTMAVDEGSSIEVSVNASDENYDELTYIWRGDARVLTSTNTNPAILDFPTDLVAANTDTTTLILEVEVSDKSNTDGTVSSMTSVVVNKKNNGTVSGVRLDRDNQRTLTLLNIDWSREPDGGVGRNVTYQWQQCLGGADCLWENIKGAKGTSYTVPDLMNDNDSFRVELTYTDGQGYKNIAYSSSRGPSASSDIKIRSKVFLEGPLQ